MSILLSRRLGRLQKEQNGPVQVSSVRVYMEGDVDDRESLSVRLAWRRGNECGWCCS